MYLLMVEQLERRVATLQIVTAISNINAQEQSDLSDIPDPDVYREEFDEWLNSAPKVVSTVDRERLELMQALGLAGR